MMRGFSLLLFVIALVNFLFYFIVVFTTFNESDRYLFAIISGIRSIFTISALCGFCVMLLKLYAGFGNNNE